MSRNRRTFMRDMAAAGTVVAAGVTMAGHGGHADVPSYEPSENRCPYFDQPLYCEGLGKNGGPLCGEDDDGG